MPERKIQQPTLETARLYFAVISARPSLLTLLQNIAFNTSVLFSNANDITMGFTDLLQDTGLQRMFSQPGERQRDSLLTFHSA